MATTLDLHEALGRAISPPDSSLDTKIQYHWQDLLPKPKLLMPLPLSQTLDEEKEDDDGANTNTNSYCYQRCWPLVGGEISAQRVTLKVYRELIETNPFTRAL